MNGLPRYISPLEIQISSLMTTIAKSNSMNALRLAWCYYQIRREVLNPTSFDVENAIRHSISRFYNPVYQRRKSVLDNLAELEVRKLYPGIGDDEEALNRWKNRSPENLEQYNAMRARVKTWSQNGQNISEFINVLGLGSLILWSVTLSRIKYTAQQKIHSLSVLTRRILIRVLQNLPQLGDLQAFCNFCQEWLEDFLFGKQNSFQIISRLRSWASTHMHQDWLEGLPPAFDNHIEGLDQSHTYLDGPDTSTDPWYALVDTLPRYNDNSWTPPRLYTSLHLLQRNQLLDGDTIQNVLNSLNLQHPPTTFIPDNAQYGSFVLQLLPEAEHRQVLANMAPIPTQIDRYVFFPFNFYILS